MKLSVIQLNSILKLENKLNILPQNITDIDHSTENADVLISFSLSNNYSENN